MVLAGYTLLLFLHCYWSLTVSAENFTEIKTIQLEDTVLRISCGVINDTSAVKPIQMSAFADTIDNTLASVRYKECPIIEEATKFTHIYLANSVQNGENMLLDIVITHYKPTENQQFGCDYMYMVGKSVLSSVAVTTVTISENASPAPGKEEESPAATEVSTEMKKALASTPSSAVRDDTTLVDDRETWGRQGTLLLIIIATLIVQIIVNCVCLLKIRVHSNDSKVNCRFCLSSCGETAQEKNKSLEYSKDDQHEEIYVYTTIDKTLSLDKFDERTDVIDGNTPLETDNCIVRLKSSNLSSEIVIDKEEYQAENPYTQVRKLPKPVACVHNTLMD